MKIAVASNQDQVADHFGHCEAFLIYDVAGQEVLGEHKLANPGHKPGFLPNFLYDQGVSVMIAGGIGQSAVEIFQEKGIVVAAGATGACQDVVKQYIKGELPHTGAVCEH